MFWIDFVRMTWSLMIQVAAPERGGVGAPWPEATAARTRERCPRRI
jgi:hypothetical protein